MAVKRKVKRRSSAKSTAIVTKISTRAKQIRKGKSLCWQTAIIRASKELKKEGKI